MTGACMHSTAKLRHYSLWFAWNWFSFSDGFSRTIASGAVLSFGMTQIDVWATSLFRIVKYMSYCPS